MKKLVTVFALIWLSIVLIAPNYIGTKVESGLKDYMQGNDITSLQKYGISLNMIDYQRGYFSSHATILLTSTHPNDGRPLLTTELNYKITHAPLSLSGFNLAEINITNSPNFTGELSDTLPSKLIEAHAKVDLFGNIMQYITLHPFSFKAASIPIRQIKFAGANVEWFSHLKDFSQNGHGALQSPSLQWQNQLGQLIQIEKLSAELVIDDSEKTLIINDFGMNYQTVDKQSLRLDADKILQTQHFAQVNNQIIPLSRSLSITGLDMTLNNQPQAHINKLQGFVGLQKNDVHYDLNFNWVADLSVRQTINKAQFPWLAILPTKQNVSIKLTPISSKQLPTWASIIESMWQAPKLRQNSLAQLGQLLRFNVANQRMQLSLSASLMDDEVHLAKADIFIDEQIDEAQKINALLNHGLNPHWFYDSHAHISINQTWLKKMKFMPMLILLFGEHLELDDKGYFNLRADIVDQQLFINDEVTY